MAVRRIVAGMLVAGAVALYAGGACGEPLAAAGTIIEYGAKVPDRGARETALARAIGRPDSMDVLLGRLAEALRTLSHYDIGPTLPAVQRMPLDTLRTRLCGAPCTLRAAYVPGEGMFLDAALRPDVNRVHQSILFHELVHHAQEAQGVHAQRDACNRWRLREIEAYALQNRFLSAVGEPVAVMDPGMPCAAASSRAHGFHEGYAPALERAPRPGLK